MPRESSSGQVSNWGRDPEANSVQWGSRATAGTANTGADGYLWFDGIVFGTNTTYTTPQTYGVFSPFRVGQAMEIQGFRLNITNAQADGLTRVGIYRADKQWELGELLHDFGTVDSSTNGTKTVSSLAVPIPAGRYYCYVEGNKGFTLNGYVSTYVSVDFSAYGWNIYRDSGSAAALPTTITTLGVSALFGSRPFACPMWRAVVV
jgi:hypothetical protein